MGPLALAFLLRWSFDDAGVGERFPQEAHSGRFLRWSIPYAGDCFVLGTI
jgi:hypothetical protein